ncbi:hypothetical protein BACCAP_02813 [Pseudoflavonifractor capillosus ATCC 29799]|uniref:Uncharacterized protein n=1 Tax=Pseudoflavonifractor capillosus ATCC 29799 TaxID=411467 RepID=A6NX68_9FIRM|nr:hypothetical protein BACCAP_02813 [Pseudoflavonifractor capillosus ATCC 29799]
MNLFVHIPAIPCGQKSLRTVCPEAFSDGIGVLSVRLSRWRRR